MNKIIYNNREFIKIKGRLNTPTEILALDTENANSLNNIKNMKTFLWAIQMGGINETFESETWLYKDWDEVFDNLRNRLLPISNSRHKIQPDIIIYVHNLAHDWSHMKKYVCDNFK